MINRFKLNDCVYKKHTIECCVDREDDYKKFISFIKEIIITENGIKYKVKYHKGFNDEIYDEKELVHCRKVKDFIKDYLNNKLQIYDCV